MSLNNPFGMNVVSPPTIPAPWRVPPQGNTLSMGAQGPMHIQTLAFVGGNSPSPMQRLGMAPINALGMLAPDQNEAGYGFGTHAPAAEGSLWAPLMTTAGMLVTQLSTSAK